MSESPEDRRRPALRRRTHQRPVAGVAGGLADWLNAPVAFVRVFLLLASVVLPVVVWVYLAAAAVIPPRGRNRPGWDNLVVVSRVAVLFAVPTIVMGQSVGINEIIGESGGYWIALLGLPLVGAGVLLSADYRRGRARTEAEQRSVVLAAVPVAAFVAALAAGVVLITDVRWERLLPLGVAVAGLALLAGVYTGRARAFVAPAVLALGLAAALIASDVRLEGGVGDTRIVESRIPAGSMVVRRARGDVDLDLRRLTSSRPVRLEASVGHGRLRIAVPGQARVVVDGYVGQGRINAFSMDSSSTYEVGFSRRASLNWPPRNRKRPTTATIRVSAEVGVGELWVERGRGALAAR